MPDRIYQINRITVAALLLLLGNSVACVQQIDAGGGAVVRASRPLMGTKFEISIWSPISEQPQAAEAIQQALDLVATIEKTISSWIATSETSAVNQAAANSSVTIGPDLQRLLADSLFWAKQTDGALDITGGPLFERWARARKEGVLPTKSEIERCLDRIGYQHVTAENSTVKLAKPDMQIGFGAVGKGFAADCVSELLRELGFLNFVIDAGGDIIVSGDRGGPRWQVAIQHPRRTGYLAVFGVTDRAIATSGDYEQFLLVGGKRFSHIVDPRTGWPVQSIASATVITQRGIDADALATSLCVLGVKQGMPLIEQLPETEALVVLCDGTTRLSKGLKLGDDYLEMVQ